MVEFWNHSNCQDVASCKCGGDSHDYDARFSEASHVLSAGSKDARVGMVGSVDARVGTEVKHAEELELVINDIRHLFPDSIMSSRPSQRNRTGSSVKVESH